MGLIASFKKHHHEFMLVENAKALLHVAMIQYVAMNKLLGYWFNESALFEEIEKIDQRRQLEDWSRRLDLGIFETQNRRPDEPRLRCRVHVNDNVVVVWVEINAQSRLAVGGGPKALVLQFNQGHWEHPYESDILLGQVLVTRVSGWLRQKIMINAIMKVPEIWAPMERILKDVIHVHGPHVGDYAHAALRHWRTSQTLNPKE